MRIQSSVTAISWIPSDVVEGLTRLPMDLGLTPYDAPPPDRLEDLEALRRAHAYRFANRLEGWVEVSNGRIIDHGQTGHGYIGATKVRLGFIGAAFEGVLFDPITPAAIVSGNAVEFTQTMGGATAFPLPRPVSGKPFFMFSAPPAWTTLSLTVRTDGSSTGTLVGASTFPRHWIYDDTGSLVAKSGIVDFRTWATEAHGRHTPWGHEDSPAFVAEAETAHERELSRSIMAGSSRRHVQRIDTGVLLTEQGAPGDELYLVLDGVLSVEVDGSVVAQVGPGALFGERAILEGSRRTASLRAVTPVRVAVVPGELVERGRLAEIATGHRREVPAHKEGQ